MMSLRIPPSYFIEHNYKKNVNPFLRREDSYVVDMETFSMERIFELANWCNDNTTMGWTTEGFCFLFEDEADAAMFKLIM